MKFIEVIGSKNEFVALIPIELLKHEGYVDPKRIQDLIEHMALRETSSFFSSSIITDSIYITENLVNALPEVRSSTYGLLPVLSSEGRLLGIITTGIIEGRIADQVLALQEID